MGARKAHGARPWSVFFLSRRFFLLTVVSYPARLLRPQAIVALWAWPTFSARLHQIDRIVRLSKGGDDSIENLPVVSKGENSQEGRRLLRLVIL